MVMHEMPSPWLYYAEYIQNEQNTMLYGLYTLVINMYLYQIKFPYKWS